MSSGPKVLFHIRTQERADEVSRQLGGLPKHVKDNLVGGDVVRCGDRGQVCVETAIHTDPKGGDRHRDAVTVDPKNGVSNPALSDRGTGETLDGPEQRDVFRRGTQAKAKLFAQTAKCGHPLTQDMETARVRLGLPACKK